MKLCNETFNFLFVNSLLNVRINIENTKTIHKRYDDDVDFDQFIIKIERIQHLNKVTSTLTKEASVVDLFLLDNCHTMPKC